MCKTVVKSALPFFFFSSSSSSSFFFGGGGGAWHTCHCNVTLPYAVSPGDAFVEKTQSS